MSKLNNPNGSAILVALALMLIVSGIAIVTVNNSTTDMDLSYNQLHEEQAFYVAEAGAKRAFSVLNLDSDWRTGYSAEAFGEGAYTVTIQDSTINPALDDTVIVMSTAVVDGSRATIELTLAPEVYNPFTYAMFAKNLLDVRNSFVTDSYNSDSGGYAATRLFEDGDIGSNGNIIVKNGAQIGGDITTSLLGGADVHWGATVAGVISDTAPEQEVPDIPNEEFVWAESINAASTGITGTYSYNPSTNALTATGNFVLTSGVYYFSDIILKNSASLELAPGAEVTIYVTGDIEMKHASEINVGGDPGDVTIYSQGDFVLKNSGDIAATFYSTTGTADLRNSGVFSGSIVAYDIICHNSANFHYDRQLTNIEREGSGSYELIAWGESY